MREDRRKTVTLEKPIILDFADERRIECVRVGGVDFLGNVSGFKL